MNNKNKPTYKFDSYKDISVDFLKENGYDTILADLDDTLSEHGSQVISDSLKNWLNEIGENGVRLIIISNNSKKRVEKFAGNIGVEFVSRAFKPATKIILKKIKGIGCGEKNILFIGDQLFTDIRCANNMNIDSVLVNPVGNKTTLFIKLKRAFERNQK